jgi:hypothetical protein
MFFSVSAACMIHPYNIGTEISGQDYIWLGETLLYSEHLEYAAGLEKALYCF